MSETERESKCICRFCFNGSGGVNYAKLSIVSLCLFFKVVPILPHPPDPLNLARFGDCKV